MTLPSPPNTICPALTQAQARKLNHLKRSGHNVVAYESLIGDRMSAVVFITTRTEFAISDDGTTLDVAALVADGTLPARSDSGRRRSLRNPSDNDDRSNDVH
jgi:hypothetical protein